MKKNKKMRNRRTLHEEISRMRVLMETQLLTESRFKGVADTLLSLSDQLAELVAKHSDTFQRLETAENDVKALKVLADLVDLEKGFADQIIPRVMDAFEGTPTGNEITKAINKLIELKKAGGKIDDEVINFYVSPAVLGDPSLNRIVKKEISNILDGVEKAPLLVPTPKTTPKGDVTVDDMKKVFSYWDKISPRTLSAADKLAMSDKWFRGLRAKLKWTLSNILNQKVPFGDWGRTQSMEKIVGLLKTGFDDLERRAEINPELYKLIDLELDALRRNKNYVKEEMYNVIRSEVNKATGGLRGQEIVNAMKKNDQFSPEAESFFKSLLNDNSLINEISKVTGKIPFGIGERGNIIEVTENIMLLFQRILGLFTTGFATNLRSMFKTLRASGVGLNRGTKDLYLYFWGMSKLVWPVFFAFKDWIVNSLITQDERFKETEESLYYFLEKNFLDALGIYNEEFFEIFGYQIPPPYSKIIRAVNPFTNIWQKIKDGTDYWFTQGGLRELIMDAYNNSGERIENFEEQLDSVMQSQNQRLDSIIDDAQQRRLDSIRNLPVVDTTSLRGVNTTSTTTVPQTSTTTVSQTSGRNRDN